MAPNLNFYFYRIYDLGSMKYSNIRETTYIQENTLLKVLFPAYQFLVSINYVNKQTLKKAPSFLLRLCIPRYRGIQMNYLYSRSLRFVYAIYSLPESGYFGGHLVLHRAFNHAS